MILQPIIDIATICAKKGIKHAILSPGSRSAPITLAFVRHPEIHCRIISDERAAAFVALGMAQQLGKPVVLVCTSGSAALNYAPAVAEAFFQQIPLFILTADRPPEWIDQWDGQTIRQDSIYGKHIKESYSFPSEFSPKENIWYANRMVNEALNTAVAHPQGPVHLNVPLREPFYPTADEVFSFDHSPKIIESIHNLPMLSKDNRSILKVALEPYKKILIVPGQQRPDQEIAALLDKMAREKKAVVVTDVISNLQSDQSIIHHDFFLRNPSDADHFSPDLIISFGKSIISKPLKSFLRKTAADHWHIQPAGYVPDTYQRLTKWIQADPLEMLGFLDENLGKADPRFHERWRSADNGIKHRLPAVMESAEFGEFKAVYLCLKQAPSSAKIHLANSMPVRYVNFLGIKAKLQEVICNRGTSGIDGSNSTAVGCAFTTKEPVLLFTGDMAFFYDRNAFWHQYSIPHLRIILLNNHAGGIFRLIDGPSSLPELEEYFETRQSLNAELIAKEHGFDYYLAEDESGIRRILENFYEPSPKPKILEIVSTSQDNAAIYKNINTRMVNDGDED